MGEQTLWVEEAWQAVAEKVGRTSRRIGAAFPHSGKDGMYKLESPQWWTAGFWPGLLWLLYADGKDERLKGLAEQCEQLMDEVLADATRTDHDLGFMWSLTSVARYKLLGADDSRRRALTAAHLLLGRFNVRGKFIRAWNPWGGDHRNEGWAIIDCMMNLPLLYWASEHTGDPRFRHAAEDHARTVLNHFIDEDGAVRHIVVFDPYTGEYIGPEGGQGYGPASGWARGTSWALYGFALSYRYTGDPAFLNAAKRVAHFFVSQLPEDSVPVWDFRLPADVARPRDSSAGAIAACGLLLIADSVPETERDSYWNHGERILHSLYANYGAWTDPNEEALLLHGTGHFPLGQNIDVPLIYGDYFFAEGLRRLRGIKDSFW